MDRYSYKHIVAIEPYENGGGHYVFVKPDGHFRPPPHNNTQ